MAQQRVGDERAHARVRAAAAARQRELHRRRRRVTAVAAAVVVAVVAAMVVVKLTTGGTGNASSNSSSSSGAVAPAAVVAGLSGLPTGRVPAGTAGGVRAPGPVAQALPPLVANGKPEVLYLGAEYCPYCAAQRWPLVVALSRFGTFHGLRASHSSPSDVYPDTPSFTFVGSTYASDYVALTAVEDADVAGRPLQPMTPAQRSLAQRISGNTGIPFLDIGNRFYTSGASYDPGVLKGRTFAEIGASVAHPGAQPGASILASADRITAAICTVTKDRPAQVCATPAIDALQRGLGG